MMYISLTLDELTPKTLATIAANLSWNISEESNDTPETDRQHMIACVEQLEAIVGFEDSVEMLVEAGADPDILMPS